MPPDLLAIERKLLASDDPGLRARGAAMRMARQGSVSAAPGPNELVAPRLTPAIVSPSEPQSAPSDDTPFLASMFEPGQNVTNPAGIFDEPKAPAQTKAREPFGEKVTGVLPDIVDEAVAPREAPEGVTGGGRAVSAQMAIPGGGGLGRPLEKIRRMQANQEEEGAIHRGALDEVLKEQQRNLDAAADLGARQAQAELAQKEVALKELNAVRESYEQREKARDLEKQRAMDDLKSSWDEVSSYKIDPYASWGVGRSVLASIGVALASANGNAGIASAQINQAIDREVQAQRTELEKLKEGVDLKKNLYAMQAARHEDERAAEAATKAIMKQQLIEQMDLVAQKYKSPGIIQRAQEMKTQLEKEAIIERDKYLQAKDEHLLRSYQAEANIISQRTSLAQQRAGIMARLAAANKAAAKPLPVSELPKLSRILEVPEQIALLKKAWKAQKEGRWSTVSASINSYLPGALGTEASKYEDTIRILAGQIGRSINKGERFTDEDQDRWNRFMPQPGEDMQKGDNKIKALMALTAKRLDSYLNTMGKAGYDVEPFAKERSKALASFNNEPGNPNR